MLDSIFKNITWNDYLEDEDIEFIKNLIKVCIDIVFYTIAVIVINSTSNFMISVTHKMFNLNHCCLSAIDKMLINL